MQADVTININRNWSYNEKEMGCHTAIKLPVTGRIHEQVAQPSLQDTGGDGCIGH